MPLLDYGTRSYRITLELFFGPLTAGKAPAAGRRKVPRDLSETVAVVAAPTTACAISLVLRLDVVSFSARVVIVIHRRIVFAD